MVLLSSPVRSVQGAGANASYVRASFCVVTQPTRVLQCAEWLHAPDPCCTCWPVRVWRSGREEVYASCLWACVSMCACGALGLIACVCTPGRVRVRVSHPQPSPPLRVNCHVDFVLSFRITISDP